MNLNDSLDSLINDFIPGRLYGGTISVIYRGKNVYTKSKGRIDDLDFEYKNETIYDLASLTKPLVTSLLTLMLLERGKISLRDTIGDLQIFNEYKNLKKFSIENMLSHTTGMPPDAPLYNDGNKKEDYLRGIDRIAQRSFPDLREIYSDLNYILLGFLLEEIYGNTLDKIFEREVSSKLNLKNSFFNPKIDKKIIAPTEYSDERGLLWGKVNDEKSYYIGGVAGNAGLFSNAEDISILILSMMNGSLIKKSTFEMSIESRNTHLGGIFGLGWMVKSERRQIRSESFNYTGFLGDYSPFGTFGHTGFTGTSVCGNYERGIVCILLSNATFPKRSEKREIIRMRRLFHNIVFSSLD
jgi:CubicO group peptidase (beta-lactamase class C family)